MQFCTLFNENYLANGIALYNSLLKHSKNDFHLYVLAMDDITYEILSNQKNSKMTCISLSQFEDTELLSIKTNRTFGEYCWTCTPSLIRYCLDEFKLASCIYLDADLYFFDDPAIGWNEIPDKCSVLITEHNYHPKHDNRFMNGFYCVQYVGFKNNEDGNIVLNWWRESCLNWCFARIEDNKFGDQKYLDDWLVKFKGVWVVKNKGVGVAPWNIELYEVKKEDEGLHVIDKVTKEKYPIIFYHFHGFKVFKKKIRLTEHVYIIDDSDLKYIYQPYIDEVLQHVNGKSLSELSKKYFLKMYKKIFFEKVVEFSKLFYEKKSNPFNNIVDYKINSIKYD